MSKRQTSSEEEEHPSMVGGDEPRAVYVDTNLDTHLIVPVTFLSTVTSLKRCIRREHFECFPNLGRIEINALMVRFNDNYYQLPDYMLLKTAFHGKESWLVYADVWTSSGQLGSQNVIEFNKVEPYSQRHIEFKHVESHPQPHATPDMICNKKKKKKKKKRDDVGKVDIDNNIMQSIEIGKPEKDLETNSDAKEQFNGRARGQWAVPRTGKVSANSASKHLNETSKGHHETFVVQPSVMLFKDGGDNIVKDLAGGTELGHQLEGTRTKLAETLNKESGIDNFGPPSGFQAKKTKKKKSDLMGVKQSPAATFVKGVDILDKGDAPSDIKNICKREQKRAGELSPPQLNNVEEDVAPLKSGNKRKACGSGRESKPAERVSPLHLNNVPELFLSHDESLNIAARENVNDDYVAPVKLENTAKKRKTHKAKSSGTENQDLSSKRQNDNQKADDTRDICGEHLLPDNISRSEESLETMTGFPKKRTRNRKAAPGKDLPGSPVKEQPDEDTNEIAPPMTVIQSDKPKKRSQKKLPVPAVDPSSLAVDRNLGETTIELELELDAPKKADNFLTKCDTKGILLKSDNTAKKRKTNESERESGTAQMVPQSHLNSVPELLSQDESLKFVEREKEIEEVVPLKSENTAKKRKSSNVKSYDTENKDLSSKRQNDDQNADNSRHDHRELLLTDDIRRPEERVDSISESLKKKTRDRKAVSGRDSPGSPLKEQPDEEIRERAAPKTVIHSDKPMKRSQKKQPVSGKDLSSLPGNQHLVESTMNVDAPICADDLSTSNIDDSKNQKKVINVEGYQDDLSEIPSREVSSGVADLRLLEKSRARKQKAKKLDQPSAVSDGHNLVDSKKNGGSAKTSELQKLSTEQGHNKSTLPLMDTLVPLSNPTKPSKISSDFLSVDDGSRVSGENIMIKRAPMRVEQADDLYTDAGSNDAQDQKVVNQDEDHGEVRQAPPRLEVSPGLVDMRQFENPQASKQKAKKHDQPSSVDTSSNGHSLFGSKKNRESAKTSELEKSFTDQKHDKSIPSLSAKHSTMSKRMKDILATVADPTNTSSKTGVPRTSVDDGSKSSEALTMSFGSAVRKVPLEKKVKEPPKKLEENHVGLRKSSHLSVKEVKNGLLASSGAIFEDGTSSSSGDESGTDALSSSATPPPDNLSSPDYSEGESEGVVISQPDTSDGNGRSKANSSGLKLESILRSSRSYKKAKLVAVQSKEESPPPEFVPDSLPDI